MSILGTFGGNDFIHSLLGEATDKLSQTNINELDVQLHNAQQKQNSGKGSISAIKNIMNLIPGFGAMGGGDMSRDLDNMERSRAMGMSRDPMTMSPQEIRNSIWPILVFRDNSTLLNLLYTASR